VPAPNPHALELILGFGGPYAAPNPHALELVLGPITGAPGTTVDATLEGTIKVAAALSAGDRSDAVVTGSIRLQWTLIATQQTDAVRVEATVGVPWKRKAAPLARSLSNEFVGGTPLLGDMRHPWSGRVLSPAAPKRAPWGNGVPLRGAEPRAPWDGAEPLPQESRALPWDGGAPLHGEDAVLAWRGALQRNGVRALPWDGAAPFNRFSLVAAWRRAVAAGRSTRAPWHQGSLRTVTNRLPWRDGRTRRRNPSPSTCISASRRGCRTRIASTLFSASTRVTACSTAARSSSLSGASIS
jgi:hypothetical protein